MAKKYSTHKQKGQQKFQVEASARVVLGKEEYQAWKNLRAKHLMITQKQFKNYLSEVKQANAKLNRIQNDKRFFSDVRIKLTENLLTANTQSELERLLMKPSEILDDNYEQNMTRENIDRLQENVDRVFGEGVINFRGLSPEQLNRFFEENEHLVYLIYYPEDTVASNLVEMTGGVDALKKSVAYWKKK